MILTCPQCASRYMVDPRRIPPKGRTVRCASCGESWRAQQDFQQETALDLDAAAAHPPAEAQAQAEDRPAAAGIPQTMRARHKARRETRKAVAAGAVWGVLGAVLVAVIAAAALLRVDVVRLWPRTAGAYAAVGLPVNPTGLAPESVEAVPGLKDGHAAVIVTGLVRNVETRAHDLTPLKVSLLDKAGKPLATKVVGLPRTRLAPGKTHPFTLAFLDPPSASADVQVEFMLDAPQGHGPKPPAPKPHAAPKPHEAAEPAQHSTAEAHAPAPLPVKAAQALPADSPYALPAHTAQQGVAEHGHDG